MNKKTEEYHKELLGDEFSDFVQWSKSPQRKSIRINPIKTTAEEFGDELDKMGAVDIPWCKEGFWVNEGSWGATIPHQFGYYYIQEASSMLPAEILAPEKNETILDLAAAPGSKSTQIAPRCSTIVANEPDYKRRRALVANMERLGVTNDIITAFDGTRFPRDLEFEKILLDAPCSNIGSARKSKNVLKTWSPSFAKNISGLQKHLIISAFDRLAVGGVLVYSTCTSTIEENEGVVSYLLKKRGGARLERDNDIDIIARDGLVEGTEKTMRIYPWDNDTDFFFVAKIRKTKDDGLD